MTRYEQYMHCEVCEHHKIIHCGGGFAFMGCRCGDYSGHPVWEDDWVCPLGDKKPIREIKESGYLI